MHDDSPAGQAVKDRTLAYWTDGNNFPAYLSPNDIAFNNIISTLS